MRLSPLPPLTWLLAASLLLAPPVGAQSLAELTGDGLLFLPPAPVKMAVAVLPTCAPAGAAEEWARRLAAWGYGVLLYSGSDRARECEPTTLDRTTLNGFRRASMELSRRSGSAEPALVALGWDTRLLIHAAASVFGGRDLFRAIVSLGTDVPYIGSPLPMYRAEDDNPAKVRIFLAEQEIELSSARPASLPSTGHWVEDPRAPTSDLPATGASLFDRLFSMDGRHRVPFPFDDLIADLNARLGPPGSGRDVLHALIPRGRSLQRHAAAGDADRFPRVVLGIDQFPDESDGRWRPLLRDRLFIAYQETSGVLEVVSFNDDAGRFEFQVVHDYRAGAEPRVVYPPRRLCVSCHQNAGPLFSEAPWDETADNPRVASRIREIRPRPYGLAVPVADNQALLLDTSTDRANLLPLQALLWRDGCGRREEERVRCRAAALQRMLQYRLSRQLDFDRHGRGYQEDFLPAAKSSWRTYWPSGLHVPSADIPNRDVQRDGLTVTPRLDPLRRRAPLETWTADNGGIDHLIEELASQLSQTDLATLDRFLRNRASIRGGQSRQWQAPCQVERQFERLGIVSRVIDCASVDLRMRGSLSFDALDRPVDGVIDTLIVAQGQRVGELVATADESGSAFALSFWGSPYGVRPIPGQLVQTLELAWKADQLVATVLTVPDFEPIVSAISTLVELPANENSFAVDEFRPRQVMQSLFAVLGIGDVPEPMQSEPTTQHVLETVAVSAADRRLVPFVRHCAPCHAGQRPFPPPFLSGEPSTVVRRLARCAPRMARRLSMWGLEPAERAKTPMPPPVLLVSTAGADLAAELLALVSELVSEARFDPGVPYSDLEPCI